MYQIYLDLSLSIKCTLYILHKILVNQLPRKSIPLLHLLDPLVWKVCAKTPSSGNLLFAM